MFSQAWTALLYSGSFPLPFYLGYFTTVCCLLSLKTYLENFFSSCVRHLRIFSLQRLPLISSVDKEQDCFAVFSKCCHWKPSWSKSTCQLGALYIYFATNRNSLAFLFSFENTGDLVSAHKSSGNKPTDLSSKCMPRVWVKILNRKDLGNMD